MEILKFKIFEAYGVVLRHGLSTRKGGVSGREAGNENLASMNLGLPGDIDSEENLRENYRSFCEAVGVDEECLVVPIQEHSDKILVLKEGAHFVPGNGISLPDHDGKFGWRKPVEGYDGLITNAKNLPVMVRFADCQGVLFFDPVKSVIAAVHCGWRGNVQNIIGKAVKKMVAEFGCDAGDILVGISQSLGPCHAEFTDPAKELPEWMQEYVGKKAGAKELHVDLWQCSFDQLTETGIVAKNIEMMRRCTVCENNIFFSYRVAGEKYGRMGAVIQLTPNLHSFQIDQGTNS